MANSNEGHDYEAHLAELYVRMGTVRKRHAAGQATDAELARIEAEVAEARRVLGPVIMKKRRQRGI